MMLLPPQINHGCRCYLWWANFPPEPAPCGRSSCRTSSVTRSPSSLLAAVHGDDPRRIPWTRRGSMVPAEWRTFAAGDRPDGPGPASPRRRCSCSSTAGTTTTGPYLYTSEKPEQLDAVVRARVLPRIAQTFEWKPRHGRRGDHRRTDSRPCSSFAQKAFVQGHHPDRCQGLTPTSRPRHTTFHGLRTKPPAYA